MSIEKLDSIQEKQYIELVLLLQKYFKNDIEKIYLWIHTKNLNLGGISPIRMILFDRFHRLKRWIEIQYEENQIEIEDTTKYNEENLK